MMQIIGQQVIEEHEVGTERIKGARRNRKGGAAGKVVIITPTTTGASLMLPGGVEGKVYRVVGDKVHINLVLDLAHMEER
jgi:hypothetical protein